MRTKSITLVYKLDGKETYPPSPKEIERKDKFLADIQRTIEAPWKPVMVKVRYELVNPEVEKLRKFFHTCIMYYAIQNLQMTEGKPSTAQFKEYRELVLDELLGYDYTAVKKVIHKRKSTTEAEYQDTQAWLTLLKELEETLFFDAGYHFPDSKWFWETVEQHGYEKAQEIALGQLQAKMKKVV